MLKCLCNLFLFFETFSLPGLVHQISSPRFVVFQVLLELVVDRPRMILQKEAREQQKYASLQIKSRSKGDNGNKQTCVSGCLRVSAN